MGLSRSKPRLVAGTGSWTAFSLQTDVPKACGVGRGGAPGMESGGGGSCLCCLPPTAGGLGR